MMMLVQAYKDKEEDKMRIPQEEEEGEVKAMLVEEEEDLINKMSNIKIHCKEYGDFEKECKMKVVNEAKKAKYANENEEEHSSKLCLICGIAEKTSQETWYLDSGCFNQMTTNKELCLHE